MITAGNPLATIRNRFLKAETIYVCYRPGKKDSGSAQYDKRNTRV